jgi:hypothetical protein
VNFKAKRERFVRLPVPMRLGSLAADLARVSSTARHDKITPIVETMMTESVYFIEWTAAETEPEVAAELVDIQRMLGLLLSIQAKKWSEQVLGYSGLLEE